MTDADPVVIALRIAGLLERLGVRYVLGGSLASVVFGEPRATLDVDLAVDLSPTQVDEFVSAASNEFLVDREWVRSEVHRHGSFQLVHQESMIRVGVFVPEWTGFHRWKWEQRRRVQVGADEFLDVTGPEAIVIQKLTWFRSGGEASDRQWRDVLGVLKNQGAALDLTVMKEQAGVCGVADLLARAVEAAGLS